MPGEYSKYSWLKWVIAIFLIVIIVAIIAYVVWLLSRPRRNGCGQKKRCKKPVECVKHSYLQLNGTGVIPLQSPSEDFLLLEMTFNDPALVQEPCKGWKTVNSTVTNFTQAITGIAAPCDGDYYFEYHVGMFSLGAVVVILKNGLVVGRSASFTLDLQDAPQLCGRQLSKSFTLHLNKDDVVNLLVVPFILDNFSIDEYPSTSDFRYLTTLYIEEVTKDKCKRNCEPCDNDADVNTDSPINFEAPSIQSSLLQSIANLKEQLLTQDHQNPNAAAAIQAFTSAISA
jgi:hypothetical protein